MSHKPFQRKTVPQIYVTLICHGTPSPSNVQWACSGTWNQTRLHWRCLQKASHFPDVMSHQLSTAFTTLWVLQLRWPLQVNYFCAFCQQALAICTQETGMRPCLRPRGQPGKNLTVLCASLMSCFLIPSRWKLLLPFWLPNGDLSFKNCLQ